MKQTYMAILVLAVLSSASAGEPRKDLDQPLKPLSSKIKAKDLKKDPDKTKSDKKPERKPVKRSRPQSQKTTKKKEDPPRKARATSAGATVKLNSKAEQARDRWIVKHWCDSNYRRSRFVTIAVESDEDSVYGHAHRRFHPDLGQLESIVVNVSAGDHGGILEEFFYWDGKPFFLVRVASHWRFDPDNPRASIDYAEEERYFFTEGGRDVYRALSKKYHAKESESLKAAQDAAHNTILKYPRGRPAELNRRAAKLLAAKTGAAVIAAYR